jgi:bile acid-coenzyme A ligase
LWDPDAPFLKFPDRGSMLIPGPLYHNGPFVWATGGLFKGNTVSVTTRFDAEQTLSIIEAQRVDTIYLVPTMMQRIWNLPTDVRLRYDVSSMRTLWHLAAPCPAWLKQAFIDWFGADVIWELYGGTESQGATVITGTEWLTRRGSVGRPIATCEMKIVGEDGSTLPVGEVGEVYMRPLSGAGTTYRYIGADAKTMEGGWESLGDMGHLDADGYLYLADRLIDMILVGGANVYPAEVEAVIVELADVVDVAVIGLPDEQWGEVGCAFVVPAAHTSLDTATLQAHCQSRLARFKVPKRFEIVPSLPRTPSGKVQKHLLREHRLFDNEKPKST